MIQLTGKTDIGARRTNNQDTFACGTLCNNASYAVVCDGMGGCNGGNVASATAVSVFSSFLKLNTVPYIDENGRMEIDETTLTEILMNACGAANRAVFEKAASDAELTGMGTTLVTAVIIDETAYIANIGDSRLYLITPEETVQITKDHSFVQYLVDIGELTPDQAAVNPNRNVITRAVGSEEQVLPDLFSLDLHDNGSCHLLLCTDGLTNYAEQSDIFFCVNGDGTDSEKAQKLIDLANDGGGGDNITVIIGTYED